MQTSENEEGKIRVAPAESQSQPEPPVSSAQTIADDDEPDQIFLRAVAEIDTQPLVTPKRTEPFTIGEVFEVCLIVGVLFFSLFGVIWQCLTYPHTLVVLFTKAKPAHITAALDVPTRIVAPVTITRSAATATTGTGHQDARAASGILTFYNGNVNPQTIPGETVVQGQDDIKVATLEAVTIPAANLPQVGEATVSARALVLGSQGNIAAFDINSALSGDVKVSNEAAFHNGQDARTFRAVADRDLQTVTSKLNALLTQAFTTAFSLQPGEEALPTRCHTTTRANHAVNDEATSVTGTSVKTCSAIAYNRQQLERLAMVAFTRTRPVATYYLIGSVQTTVQSVSPLTVTLSGKWAYTFSPDYEQSLAESIAGDTPAQAQKILLRTGVISYASIPRTLPPAAMYINFLVLVG